MGGGQVIYLSPEGEYFQANLVDITLSSVESREIVLTVEGYRKLVCTVDDSHSLTVIGGVKIETRSIRLKAEYLQVQKRGTPNERIRLYCKSGKAFFLPYNNPLCLVYEGQKLISGPTREFFVSHMREENLKLKPQ